MKKKLQARISRLLSAALIAVLVVLSSITLVRAQEQTIHERMFHSRAVEAAVWAMPLLNFKGS